MSFRTFPVLLTILLFAAFSGVSFAGPPNGAGSGVESIGGTLDLKRCLEIALRRQPGIRAAAAQAAASQSRVGQARAGYYPIVDLTAGYEWNDSSTTSDRAGEGGSFTSGVSLFQNIYDFGRTSSQVKIQEHDAGAFRFDLQDTLAAAAFNTKQAYFSLLQAKRNSELSREIIKQFERQLDQAKGFFEVGLRPRFDVTRAEVDLSNARVGLIRSENEVRLSLARLKNAMGVPDAPDFDVIDDLELKRVELTFDEAMSRALDNRQDLRAAGERKKAVEESVESARSGYYPFVTGNADYTWDSGDSSRSDDWSAGVNLTLPLFSGFLTKHRVQESKANLAAFDAGEDIVRQNVIFEVEQAYSNLREADERVPAAELALRQAEENLEIANGRYAAGVGSPIEVTDAALVFVNAKTAYIQALTDYKTAAASLQRAMGETGDDDEG
jgi:TolC family type I secretion outer membrane protein